MKWHNSRAPWQERKDRHRRNAIRKAAYQANPEFWRNKAQQWRIEHPERAAYFAAEQKRKHWSSPWRKAITSAKSRAKKKDLPFDLTFEWAEQRWTGFCELTGIPFSPRRGAPYNLFSPSLDRKDPALGYTQSNCRFVLFGINCFKNDATDDVMYFVAESLLSFRSELQKAAPCKLYPQKLADDLADTML